MGSGEEHGFDSLENLKVLCEMLRDHGDTVMRGETSLTMTAQMLCKLNDAIDNLQDGLSPPHLSLSVQDGRQERARAAELEDWNNHLQLLLDIISRTPVLTVYSGKEQDKLAYRCGVFPVPTSPPIRLGYFANLQQLSVSFVPVGLIQDMLKLRPRLQSLSLTNCLAHGAKLQDILEVCDRDISVPMQWTSLKHLNLRCNDLRELDGSLRLCPVLETLDLSFNRLSSTDVYLGYLMELRKVDLSYNLLETLPSVAATAKKKLHTLLLAGNKLTDISGIDDMDSLVVLDLSENHISSHSRLVPVRQLHRLEQTSRLSIHREPPHFHPPAANLFMVRSRPVDRIGDSPLLVAPGNADQDSVDGGLASGVPVTVAGKKKSRRKAKQRLLEIADMDTSTGGDVSSSREVSPASSPRVPSRLEAAVQTRRKEVRKTRQDIEELRRHYGDNWLQAITDQDKLPRPAPAAEMPDITATSSAAAVSTPQRISELRKSGDRKDGGSSFGAESAGESPGQLDNSSTSATELRRVVHWNGMKSADHAQHQRTVFVDVEAKVFDKDTMLPGSFSETDQADGDVVSPHSRHSDKASLVHSAKSGNTDGGLGSSGAENGVVNRGFVQDEETKTKEQSVADEESFQYADRRKKGEAEANVTVSESSSCHDSIQEPEDQSEPFIVTLPDKGDDHLIVTVSPRYLVEKDINGKIQEILDLQSLENARLEIEKVEAENRDAKAGEDVDQIVKVRMDFSYIRKDRRQRVYVMEDFTTAQHLMELVQPFLEAKAEAALRKLMTEYQCLKCNEVFTRGKAYTSVLMGNIPRTGSIKDFEALAEQGGEKVILMCPKCQSDHVVLLESGGDGKESGAATTPVGSLPSASPLGSFKRKQSLDQLVSGQSPAAHSTPNKQFGSSSETQFSRSLERPGVTSRSAKQANPFRALFTQDDKHGDGPDSNLLQKQEGSPKGRQRSNAFRVNLPDDETAENPTGGDVRRTSSLNTSERAMFVASTSSSSLSSVPVSDALHKSAVSNLNNPYMVGPSNSVDLPHKWVQGHMSSVDSDITILQHHDSAVSLGAASSAFSDTETSSTEMRQDHRSIPPSKLATGSEPSPLVTERDGETKPLEVKDCKSDGREKGTESTEATPLGSPLSSSICSSMVSSIYHNSLQPNTSSSTDYLTASNHSSVVAAEGEGDSRLEGEENESSIYDQTMSTVRNRSPHKVSISSEVEVLMVEQAVKESMMGGELSSDDLSTEHLEAVLDPADHSGLQEAEGDGNSFDRLDHRLALHLMMAVFDNNEEFRLKTTTCVCQYMMEDEYNALVVITNMKMYILRINTDDVSVEPKDALTCVEIQPLAELKRVEVGLGRQTIRLEFTTDCSSYTLIMRNEEKVEAFLERLSDHLKAYAMETDIPMSTVFDEEVDQNTLDNLSADVLQRGGQANSLRLYVLGYIARGHSLQYPIAFVVSDSEICLVRTNHQWPSPRLQAPVTVETVGRQFVVLERQQINNIATITRHPSKKHLMRITFFNESSGEETNWLITMEIEKSIVGLIDAIRQPWEEAFGVEMDVETEEFELCF
ncbi:hypothetical protein BaRGS_00025787 [Batillaria attramentaria]|uniref:Serine/threonine-protein kinase 11-interacting protein n=1 Tax=Batillaria attramentaria TaxID=370345 RepID=A0ABD0K7M9_9CAEN